MKIGVIIKQIPQGTAMIEVNGEQLAMIRLFQAHYEDIAVMLDSGVFDFKNGHAVLHRDQDGSLRKIDLNLTRFRG